MPTGKIIINLIGMGYRIYQMLEDDRTKKSVIETAQTIGVPVAYAMFDAEFFLNFPMQHINNLVQLSSRCISGLCESRKSKIEIKINGQKKLSIQLGELHQNSTLFPLYATDFNPDLNCGQNQIYMIEEEVGMIDKYELILTEEFDINKLTFNLRRIRIGHINNVVLENILYKGKNITKKKRDALVSSSYSIGFN